jgi:release factor glutamine methyltransferase
VRADEIESLEPEVRDWEPRGALVDDGQTERLVAAKAGTWLVLEVHEERAGEVSALLEREGYSDVHITPDLAGKPRVVEGRWNS